MIEVGTHAAQLFLKWPAAALAGAVPGEFTQTLAVFLEPVADFPPGDVPPTALQAKRQPIAGDGKALPDDDGERDESALVWLSIAEAGPAAAMPFIPPPPAIPVSPPGAASDTGDTGMPLVSTDGFPVTPASKKMATNKPTTPKRDTAMPPAPGEPDPERDPQRAASSPGTLPLPVAAATPGSPAAFRPAAPRTPPSLPARPPLAAIPTAPSLPGTSRLHGVTPGSPWESISRPPALPDAVRIQAQPARRPAPAPSFPHLPVQPGAPMADMARPGTPRATGPALLMAERGANPAPAWLPDTGRGLAAGLPYSSRPAAPVAMPAEVAAPRHDVFVTPPRFAPSAASLTLAPPVVPPLARPAALAFATRTVTAASPQPPSGQYDEAGAPGLTIALTNDRVVPAIQPPVATPPTPVALAPLAPPAEGGIQRLAAETPARSIGPVAAGMPAAPVPGANGVAALAPRVASLAPQVADLTPVAPAVTPVGAQPSASMVAGSGPFLTPKPGAQLFTAAISGATMPLRDTGREDPNEARTSITLAGVAIDTAQRSVVQPTGDVPRAAIDLRQDQGLQRMIDRIELLRDDANARDTRIRLVPDRLGTVDITVRRTGDSLQVHFTAQTQMTATLIAEAQPRLAELADARGVKLGQTSVDTGSGTQRQHQPAHQPAPDPTRRHPAAPVATGHGTRTEVTGHRIA